MLATLQTQRTFFNTGITKTYKYRIQQLKALKQAIIQNEEAINEHTKTVQRVII